MPNIASPIRYGRTPFVHPVAAPDIGQHTREVLRDVLGYGEQRIGNLARAGTCGKRFPHG